MTGQERILETALRLFRTYGIKSVTMFDIARECGISKKTVYEHFADKEALIKEGVNALLNGLQQQLEQCRDGEPNAIAEMIQTTHQMEVLARTMNPLMMHEVKKYHPEVSQAVEDFKRERVFKGIRGNLERGVKEGLYQPNLKMDILARLRQLQLESAFDPEQYPAAQFDLHEVMQQVTANYILGIATATGREVMERELVKDKEMITP
ncbi:TetR/AcrR family transcriptional regulator [Chitinophaga agrisoli]|uniref:TetR/AcrR family transcriptional regulator n=1 Tax=Chitinophaga agrisoli TaxID=2607653 RepID=A0A5B2W0J5_9BACT|nr:TetR/AcrR family transcriptional regulator [Chitinophaga agrisoli]KAA2244875.1 TetR/AcrR family transcriptional regulator [Chitinophaga agrisoli]